MNWVNERIIKWNICDREFCVRECKYKFYKIVQNSENLKINNFKYERMSE